MCVFQIVVSLLSLVLIAIHTGGKMMELKEINKDLCLEKSWGDKDTIDDLVRWRMENIILSLVGVLCCILNVLMILSLIF